MSDVSTVVYRKGNMTFYYHRSENISDAMRVAKKVLEGLQAKGLFLPSIETLHEDGKQVGYVVSCYDKEDNDSSGVYPEDPAA